MKKTLLLLVACLTVVYPLPAAENPQNNEALKQKKESLAEETSETSHVLTINGEDIPYKATTGTLLLKDNNGEKKASIFYTAYTKEGVQDSTKRPITFCFNGGPGSSSIWLHIGTFGPRKIQLDEEGYATRPYQLENNDYSLLDLTDLVFIDPVSTGYSRPAPGEDPKQFHGVSEDIESVAEFIRLYITRNNRWTSPKYLAGESYGTTRAAGLASHLYNAHNMSLDGLLLISSVLDFQTILPDPGNDLPHIFYLPTFTATAWYHKQLSDDLQKRKLPELLKEVETFALNEYAPALLRGDSISDKERQAINEKLARYTSLSPEYIDRVNSRVDCRRFFKELLRHEKKTIGRFDCRYTGVDSDAGGEFFESDPSYDVIMGAFSTAFNHYLRNDLKCEKDDEYRIIANLYNNWDYAAKNHYLNVADTLHSTLLRNPNLRVFVASGRYDLATPYFASDYTFNHFSSLQNPVTIRYYDAGHMMYVHRPSQIKLKEDITAFMQQR